jgi:adenine-specific DNA-methyltransferase
MLKKFLSEVGEGLTPDTWWHHNENGSNKEASIELKQLFEGESVFDTPKPLKLIDRVLRLFGGGDGLIMDFFAGSGVVAQAVIEANDRDGGKKNFILVQLPEPTSNVKYPTISEIAKERLRRSLNRLESRVRSRLPLNDTSAIDQGFRVFKLTHSNFRRWQDYADTSMPGLLLQMQQHGETPLADGAKEADVLAEVALREGFALSARQAVAEEFARNRVTRITDGFNAHRLHVCLDRELWEETIDQIAALPREDVLYCFDSALSDAARLQLAEGCRVVTI